MATTIKLKNSVTTTNAPTSLVQGEVAINVTDKKVWVGNAATTPVLLLGSGADGTFTNLTVSGVASFADGTVSLPSITNIGDTNTGIFFPAADTIAFSEGGVESMRIDSSGNLGFGVTPNAWATTNSVKALQTPSGALWNFSNNFLYLGQNYFWNGTNRIYINTDGASEYQQNAGTHVWSTAPSGTVGTTATFTERMRITSSGAVGIGTSSPNAKLDVSGSFDATTGIGFRLSSNSSGANSKIQYTDAATYNWTAGTTGNAFTISNGEYPGNAGTERMRIDSSGRLIINDTTTSAYFDGKLNVTDSNIPLCSKATTQGAFASSMWNSATSGDNSFIIFGTEASFNARGSINYNRTTGLTAYNTTSDYRAKDIISPVLDSGEVIDSVPVYIGKMKDATQARPMFIAHETPDYAHTGKKDAVDKDGKPVYQQMDASSLVPVLWAEVQSLRKRLAILESK